MSTASAIVDKALEATVVGSFTRYGCQARRRLEGWSDPESMRGVTALVTGATSGLGFALSMRLATLGASVRFVARNRERARQARDRIVRASLNVDVEYFVADMAELSSVRAVGSWVDATISRLDLLVHNAGAITPTRTLTSDGYETTVASQVIGPFLLTTLVMPELRAATGARVISVSSGGMYSQRFDLDRLEMDGRDYDGVTAYARSKRAQVVATHEWARRVDPKEVAFHCMHPGWVDTPGVRTSLPTFNRLLGPSLRTTDQGIDTILWLATTTTLEPASGGFWFDRHVRGEYRLPATRSRHPLDDQRQLWAWCEARISA